MVTFIQCKGGIVKGKIEGSLIESLLEALPMEITVIDRENRIVAWNEREPRLFPRDEEIIGRDVRTCHSAESNRMIDSMLSQMKAGSRDVFHFWYDHEMKDDGRKEKILIEYIALRDGTGGYLGCMEIMQRIGDIQGLEGERREPV
jgi:PAS domain S-box-containing protein